MPKPSLYRSEKKGEHSPCARPEIEKPVKTWRRGIQHGFFDQAIIDVQLPERIPLLGILREERGGLCRAVLAYGFKRCGVSIALFTAQRGEKTRQPRVDVSQSVKAPGPFLVGLDQSSIDKDAEMAANAGLALLQHSGEFGDGEITLRQKRKGAQAGRFARCSQLIQTFRKEHGHLAALRYKDFFISSIEPGDAGAKILCQSQC